MTDFKSADSIRKEYQIKPSTPMGKKPVRYKVLGIKFDKTLGRFRIPTWFVPPRDRAFDPETEMWKDIMFIDTIGADNKIVKGEIKFSQQTQGMLEISPSSKRGADMYAYLEASNFNKSNPHRDKSVKPIFERVAPDKAAEDKAKTRDLRFEALGIAKDMTPEEVRFWIASQGRDETRPIKTLRIETEEFAEKDPESFIKFSNNEQTRMKANLKIAQDLQIIGYRKDNFSFVWASTGDLITEIPRVPGKRPEDSLLNFVLTNPNGDAFYQEVCRLINEKKRPVREVVNEVPEDEEPKKAPVKKTAPKKTPSKRKGTKAK